MQALITGGAGFIGSNLVNAALKYFKRIVIVDDLSTGRMENIIHHPNVTFQEFSITNKCLLKKSMKNIDIVFHLAASVGNQRSFNNPIKDLTTNGIGTLNVLESAKKAGVKKVIVTSSAGVYGELKYTPTDENHTCNPISPYTASKLYSEKISMAYSNIYKKNIICLRYFNVYGINQRYDAYGNVIPIFVNRLLKNMPLIIYGNGEQTRDFVNVKDVVQANLKAAFSDNLSGVYNIGSGKEISINTLAKKLHHISQLPLNIQYLSKRPGDVENSKADIALAQQHLNYHPQISIDDGLQEYYLWMKNEYMDKN